jgi:hypothetical protein
MSTKVIFNYALRGRTRAVEPAVIFEGESPVLGPGKTHPGDRSLSDSEVYTRVAGTGHCAYRDVVCSGVTAADQREIRDGDVSRDMRVQTEPPVSAEEELHPENG